MPIIAFPRPEQFEAESVAPVVVRGGPNRGCAESTPRRSTLEQARALETLGHAVKYLIDSRLFDQVDRNPRDKEEAVQILMRMSRAVFAECTDVVPVGRRMRQWVREQFLPVGASQSWGNAGGKKVKAGTTEVAKPAPAVQLNATIHNMHYQTFDYW